MSYITVGQFSPFGTTQGQITFSYSPITSGSVAVCMVEMSSSLPLVITSDPVGDFILPNVLGPVFRPPEITLCGSFNFQNQNSNEVYPGSIYYNQTGDVILRSNSMLGQSQSPFILQTPVIFTVMGYNNT